MKFEDIAIKHPATDILSCYLAKSRHGDKTVTEQNFDIYKKCNEYKRDNFENIGYKELDELVELGLPYSLENYLSDAIKVGTLKRKKEAILYIQEVMSKKIELSKEYKDYKEIIFKKYNPSNIIKASLPHSIGSRMSIDDISGEDQLDNHGGNKEISTDPMKTSQQEDGLMDRTKKHRYVDQQTQVVAAQSCQKSIHNFFPTEFITWMIN